MRDADYVKTFKLMWGMLIIAIAVSESAWQNEVNAGLPDSSARITPFKRGMLAMFYPLRWVWLHILTEPNPGLTMVEGGS